jgi:hypothetical protein
MWPHRKELTMKINYNMMGLRSLLLALTLLMAGMVSTPAVAQVQSVSSTDFTDERQRRTEGPQFNPRDCIFEEATRDQIRACLLVGRQARVETRNRRDGILYRLDLMTNTLSVYEYLRIHGHGENMWTRSIYCADSQAHVIGGTNCAAMHSQTSRVLSGWTTFNRALSMGVGQAIPAAVAPFSGGIACSIFDCNRGPENVIITNTSSGAISTSRNRTDVGLEATVDVTTTGSGACGTGPCPTSNSRQ